jgi:hypothetical protein
MCDVGARPLPAHHVAAHQTLLDPRHVVPGSAWIHRDLADMVEDLVAGGTPVTSGLHDKQIVQTMIDDDRRGVGDQFMEIWQLLTLELWYRQQGHE